MSPRLLICTFIGCILWSFITCSQLYDPQLYLENGCPRPDAIKHGNFLLAPGHDRVHYICDEGYISVGHTYASCVHTQWTQPAPICVASGCEGLKSMKHGYISLSYGGAIAKFRCDLAYSMKGPEVIVCDGNQWNGTQPECIDPLAYKRGKDSQFNTKSNTVDMNYQKYGNSFTKSHEEWLQESDYSCIEKAEVVSPPSVLNASPFTKWVLLDGRPRLYTIYRCGWGYVPLGDSQNLYCQNRQWIGARPKCVKMPTKADVYSHFQGEEPRPDVYSSHSDWVSYADYTCMTWENHVTAPVVEHAQALARSTALDGMPHLFVEYVCEDGYKLEDGSRIYMYCHKTSWLGQLPRCIPAPSDNYSVHSQQWEEKSAYTNPLGVKKEVTCEDSKCEQLCTVTGDQVRCGCKRGYHLNPDGLTCSDVNECLDKNGGCHHTCVNTAGSYQCRCHYGYRLLPDNLTCRPIRRMRIGHEKRRPKLVKERSQG